MVRVVHVKSVFRVYVELVFPFLKLSGVPSSWGGGGARDLVTAGSGGGSLLRIYRVVLVRLRWWVFWVSPGRGYSGPCLPQPRVLQSLD